MFLFYPAWSKTNLAFEESGYQIENIAEKLIMKVRRDLGLLKAKCKICDEELYGIFNDTMKNYNKKSFPEMFILSTTYYTTEGCQEGIIAERMHSLLETEMKVQFGREYMTVTVSAAPREEYNHYLSKPHRIYNVMTLKFCSIPGTDFHQFISCPSVSLN